MLGRGSPAIQHIGNIRFRELVQSRKGEYARAHRHSEKDEIARRIVQEVTNRNGKFVRRVATMDERRYLGAPEGTPVWAVADISVALEKTKQTLREKGYFRPDQFSPENETSLMFPNVNHDSLLGGIESHQFSLPSSMPTAGNIPGRASVDDQWAQVMMPDQQQSLVASTASTIETQRQSTGQSATLSADDMAQLTSRRKLQPELGNFARERTFGQGAASDDDQLTQLILRHHLQRNSGYSSAQGQDEQRLVVPGAASVDDTWAQLLQIPVASSSIETPAQSGFPGSASVDHRLAQIAHQHHPEQNQDRYRALQLELHMLQEQEQQRQLQLRLLKEQQQARSHQQELREHQKRRLHEHDSLLNPRQGLHNALSPQDLILLWQHQQNQRQQDETTAHLDPLESQILRRDIQRDQETAISLLLQQNLRRQQQQRTQGHILDNTLLRQMMQRDLPPPQTDASTVSPLQLLRLREQQKQQHQPPPPPQSISNIPQRRMQNDMPENPQAISSRPQREQPDASSISQQQNALAILQVLRQMQHQPEGSSLVTDQHALQMRERHRINRANRQLQVASLFGAEQRNDRLSSTPPRQLGLSSAEQQQQRNREHFTDGRGSLERQMQELAQQHRQVNTTSPSRLHLDIQGRPPHSAAHLRPIADVDGLLSGIDTAEYLAVLRRQDQMLPGMISQQPTRHAAVATHTPPKTFNQISQRQQQQHLQKEGKLNTTLEEEKSVESSSTISSCDSGHSSMLEETKPPAHKKRKL